ncbi:Histidinol dehydrogenase [Camponotus japonicus]
MVQRQVLSVIFLALVSANVIQAGVLPLGLFHHENLPNFINLLDIPRIGEFATSAASAASHALSGVGSYFNDFHTGLGGLLRPPGPSKFDLLHRQDIPSRFGLLQFANRGIVPSVTSPAVVNGIADPVTSGILSTRDIPSADHLIRPGLFGRHLSGNYGIGSPTGAASSGVASSTTA